MRKMLLAVLLSVGVLGVGTGCIDPDDHRTDGVGIQQESSAPLVEIFSWWNAPGEAEALQALVDSHTVTHPHVRLFNAAAASGTKAKALLQQRLKDGDPPDLYQENAHDIRQFLNQNPDKLVNLDELVLSLGLREKGFAEVINDVTFNGHVYSLPVNLHRENTLLFNKRLFAAHNLTPPATLEEFLSVCEKLKAEGIVPVVTAYQGWILRIMFYSIAMGKMGSQAYHDYFSGKLPPNDPQFRAAIDVFGTILEKYVNPDASEEGFGWTNAALALYNGDAAMFFHGDWAKGYLAQLGWIPDVDFGVQSAPGAADLFLYGVDVFALPKGARNEKGAKEFLSTVASPAAQVAFHKLKGSSPIRRDVDRSRLDAAGRATLVELENARIRMLVHTLKVWDDAFASFAISRDADALQQVFIANPPKP